MTVKVAVAVVVAAIVLGAGLAVVLSGGDSERDPAADAPADAADVADEDEVSAPAADEPADEVADDLPDELGFVDTDCPGTLVEGSGAEFTTALGPLRLCGAEYPRAFLPGFETPVPPGLDLEILALWFEPAAGGDSGTLAELFHGDGGVEPIVTLPDGEEAVQEMGGLLSGQLVVAYTVPTGSGPTFIFRYGDNPPITLTVG